jgi:predicted SAM-dependent methyltransferase
MKSIKPENTEVMSFLEDIENVCKKHGLSLAHEDMHGAFVIEPYSIDNIEWLKSALLFESGDKPKLEYNRM